MASATTEKFKPAARGHFPGRVTRWQILPNVTVNVRGGVTYDETQQSTLSSGLTFEFM